MRPLTILYIVILLASLKLAFRYHQEAIAIDGWRQAAHEGSASAMQSLRDTSISILPWERCAWALILAELDHGQPVPMNHVPICRQMIRPEGEKLILEYTAQLKVNISQKSIRRHEP